MKKLIICAFLLLSNVTIYAQNLDAKIDSLISNVFKDENGPGGVILVSQNSKPIYHKAFGMSNIELDIPMQTTQVFQLGSMTKQFTAIAILMLEEQGKLNVKDALAKYIPDYPNGEKITLHQLLTHTSGIKDYTKMPAIADIDEKDLKPKELIDFFKNEPVDFEPGEKFVYNNSGYAILGYIIELASGETYEHYIKKYIFDKIGMHNSRYANEIAIVKNRAYGYRQKDNIYINKNKISFNIPYAAGALMSTTKDLLIWQNALNNNLLLKKSSILKAFTKYKLNNGDELTYGYGWHLKDINGIPSREHGGSIFGFKTMAVYIQSKDIYVVVLSNCDCNSPTQLARQIAAVALVN